MQKASVPTVKKSYEPPVLTIYGSVQSLTQRVGTNGQRDGGRRFRIRTHA